MPTQTPTRMHAPRHTRPETDDPTTAPSTTASAADVAAARGRRPPATVGDADPAPGRTRTGTRVDGPASARAPLTFDPVCTRRCRSLVDEANAATPDPAAVAETTDAAAPSPEPGGPATTAAGRAAPADD